MQIQHPHHPMHTQRSSQGQKNNNGHPRSKEMGCFSAPGMPKRREVGRDAQFIGSAMEAEKEPNKQRDKKGGAPPLCSWPNKNDTIKEKKKKVDAIPGDHIFCDWHYLSVSPSALGRYKEMNFCPMSLLRTWGFS